ncbi:MAG: N-acetyltransferase [Clostridia bacterium]|nr:N-acetyltransferase [Clostridia bacterium]
MELINEENRIYSLNEGGELIAEITFPALSAEKVDIHHTFVDPSLRGQGMADKLVRAAIDAILGRGLKAVATCPYAVKWFTDHTEYSDWVEIRPKSSESSDSACSLEISEGQ